MIINTQKFPINASETRNIDLLDWNKMSQTFESKFVHCSIKQNNYA